MGRATTNRVCVVIPVYNHAATVAEVARRARALHPHVIVVDDGSTDTPELGLEGLDVTLMRHGTNRGKGAAMLTGAGEAAARGMTHVITIDADGQHAPEELGRFLEAIEREPSAIHVGKRDFESAKVPASSRYGRSFSNFWLRVQTGVPLGDTQSGYRAYPIATLERLNTRRFRYDFEIEILVLAAWGGVELRDVEVSVVYHEPAKRVTHFHRLKDNLRLTALNTRLTIRSMLPWPHEKIAGEGAGEKVSLLSPMRSVAMLLRENSSPGKLAAAAGLGVLLGAFPLIGFHTITVLFATGFFRLNKVAALTTNQLCVPPLLPALCIETGYYMRHGEFLTEISLETLGYQGLERLWEWLLGALALGPVFGLAMAGVVYLMGLVAGRTLGGKVDRKD